MDIMEEIQKLSDELEQQALALRHEIHSHPELSFQEKRTGLLVMRELDRIGIPYQKSPCEPGIIGTIDSGKAGKHLLLRADMDALPIQEATGLPFASETPNVMHACGHDVHTSNLLTVAEILNRTKDRWSGKVTLVFQPAEERGGGGREMIKCGLMDEVPDACFALHVEDSLRGQILIGSHYLTAYSDGYQVTVRGRAAHSSTPEEGVDAIYIAAHIITALHGIVSRNIDPRESSTMNIGLISGGSASNVIADHVEFRCMLRNLTKESRTAMCKQIETIATGIASSMGGSCECAFHEGYPAVYNDGQFTAFVTDTLRDNASAICEGIPGSLPDDFLITGDHPLLGAEDFGFYAQKAPSCMVWIGTGGGSPKHSSTFQVEEPFLKLCTRTMAAVAVNYLRSGADGEKE
ncbi:M20 family metallopeptidase [uncultured Clostridium sp.]|uniref:M20 metallopeptidase family protein n=1 Tax=uncultured Clostridium sp. TaxID=59620 RepID=UPI0025DB0E1C|nr:M20 family metallopeptidase [uncultured Clostridium sp.]